MQGISVIAFVETKLEGGKELLKMLQGLEDKVGKKIVRKGVREAMRPTLLAAKSNAATMVGGKLGAELASTIKMRVPKRKKKGTYKISVQTRIGEAEGVYFTQSSASDIKTGKLIKGPGKRYYIPAAIEFGHAFPGRGGGKSPPKDVPAIPFMRTAADANLPTAPIILASEIRKGIEAVTRGKQ